MVFEIYKFKAKDSEINAASLCMGNVAKHFSAENLKNTELYGYVYDFLVHYYSIDVDEILLFINILLFISMMFINI